MRNIPVYRLLGARLVLLGVHSGDAQEHVPSSYSGQYVLLSHLLCCKLTAKLEMEWSLLRESFVEKHGTSYAAWASPRRGMREPSTVSE